MNPDLLAEARALRGEVREARELVQGDGPVTPPPLFESVFNYQNILTVRYTPGA